MKYRLKNYAIVLGCKMQVQFVFKICFFTECFMGTFDYQYIGSVNGTKTGLSCLSWDQVVAK